MSARTVTVQTGDHGPVTVTEPRWCATDHSDRVPFRIDVQHTGRPRYVHVGVPGGVAELLEIVRAHRPYSELPALNRPYVTVTLAEGMSWETTVPGLLLLAARLVLAGPRVVLIALAIGARSLVGGGR